MGGKPRSQPNLQPLARWQFWIDRGGTFTDCIGVEPKNGAFHVVKVLSADDSALVAIRKILSLAPGAAIPPCDIRLGTTIATNALLERRGAEVTLVVSQGFAGLLEIGDQTRPHLFALNIEAPSSLATTIIEFDSRVGPGGKTITVPSDAEFCELRHRLIDKPNVAISLIGGYLRPDIETRVGVELSRHAPHDDPGHVSISYGSDVRTIGYLARTQTAVVDAYTTPLLDAAIERLNRELGGTSSLRVMQSWGGLTADSRIRGRNAILSGPAGGVVACSEIAKQCGLARVIGFDMGGTSTDVVCIDGEPEIQYESKIGGILVRTPSLAIHTIAAGGGSIIEGHNQQLRVGPRSAGAVPGPCCYAHPNAVGATITDANLILGRAASDRFPIPLDSVAAQRAFERLSQTLGLADPRQIAAAAIEIANHSMANAVRELTVARGRDPNQYGLIVSGGAGGQHACGVAAKLGIKTIVFDRLAGVLSAYGIGLANISAASEEAFEGETLHSRALDSLRAKANTLVQRTTQMLITKGCAAEHIDIDIDIELRYVGTESTITLAIGGNPVTCHDLENQFTTLHRDRFGYARPAAAIELAALRARATARTPPPLQPRIRQGQTTPIRHQAMWTGSGMESVPVYYREDLAAQTVIDGPALILDQSGTTIIDRGWCASTDHVGRLIATAKKAPLNKSSKHHLAPAPKREPSLTLEVFANLFMSIASQMGHALERTAISTNIRERHDFSCAIFAADGALVANAPHIPVHLGAMAETVKHLIGSQPTLRRGDVYASNDPQLGGSHLPDITVISPVFVDPPGDLGGSMNPPDFFVASRGHHADVGGITPGSMPAMATELAQEGVVISMMRIVENGNLADQSLRTVLATGPYPARDIDTNLADLRAQVAANQVGIRELTRACDEHGADTIGAFMKRVQDNAAVQIAAAIATRPNGVSRFRDQLDDGSAIAVTVTIEGSRMTIDFAGTSDQHQGNLNAPRAVTMAAVLYTLRTLASGDIPLNSGCFRPVTVNIPAGSLLAPRPNAAVASGNVEVSQRVVDVLFGALGLAAASQGTMNNVTFGNETFGYYETIGGGQGASPRSPGASAVHTHMTNTRITDAEILESRFPLRLHRFEIRKGSGGVGLYRGGDGLIREIEALAALEVSVVSERRTTAPFGLAGGEDGEKGVNRIDGSSKGPRFSTTLARGQRLTIETPGGGGYGRTRVASEKF